MEWMRSNWNDASRKGEKRSKSCDAGRRPRTALVPYSDDWEAVVYAALRQMGVTKEPDRHRVLVTDRTGVQLRIFDEGQRAHALDPEFFPLRLHCQVHHNLGGKSDDAAAVASRPGGNDLRQSTPLIAFEDVWPGVLNQKLQEAGAGDTDAFVVVTDACGVEMDLNHYRDHIPMDEHFPLKLYCASQPRKTVGRWSKPDGAIRAECSVTEVKLEDLLPFAMEAKAQQLGWSGTAADGKGIAPGRVAVLLTDKTGVEVKLRDGIPDSDCFPLKLHYDVYEDLSRDSSTGSEHSASIRRKFSKTITLGAASMAAKLARLAR